jgi:hypothetical protein
MCGHYHGACMYGGERYNAMCVCIYACMCEHYHDGERYHVKMHTYIHTYIHNIRITVPVSVRIALSWSCSELIMYTYIHTCMHTCMHQALRKMRLTMRVRVRVWIWGCSCCEMWECVCLSVFVCMHVYLSACPFTKCVLISIQHAAILNFIGDRHNGPTAFSSSKLVPEFVENLPEFPIKLPFAELPLPT